PILRLSLRHKNDEITATNRFDRRRPEFPCRVGNRFKEQNWRFNAPRSRPNTCPFDWLSVRTRIVPESEPFGNGSSAAAVPVETIIMARPVADGRNLRTCYASYLHRIPNPVPEWQHNRHEYVGWITDKIQVARHVVGEKSHVVGQGVKPFKDILRIGEQ